MSALVKMPYMHVGRSATDTEEGIDDGDLLSRLETDPTTVSTMATCYVARLTRRMEEGIDDGDSLGRLDGSDEGTSRWGPLLRSMPTAAPQATVRVTGRSCAY